MTLSVPENPSELLREAAETLNHHSPTGTYGDPCGECGMPGAVLDAVADWLEATAERVDKGRRTRTQRGNHSWRGSREASVVARAILDAL